MVSWQRFVSIAYDVAKGKGAKFSGIEQGGEFVSGLSKLWNDDKQRLKQMTERQARNYLQDRVEA